jgi:hypothetical protein
MSRRLLATGLVVALIVLAGCSGFLAGDDGTMPEPDGESDGEPTYPPGVSSSGLDNATALAAAHNDSLAGESYELTVGMEATYSRDGRNTTAGSRRVVSMAENGTFLLDGTNRGTVARNETVWAAGQTAYVRTELDGEVQYDQQDATQIRPQLSAHRLLGDHLATGEFEVDSVDQRDGRTFVTLRATEFAGGSVGDSFDNVSAYEATAVVDETGRIHRLRVHIEGTDSGRYVTLDLQVELDENASVDVSRPNWVDEARERNQ